MARFCRSCGSALDDAARVCDACGARVQRAAAPAKQESFGNKCKTLINKGVTAVRNLDTAAASAYFKGYLHLILVAMVILCLIIGVMNVFGTYDVTMKASFQGESASTSGPVSELYEESDMFGDVMAVNIIYGLMNVGLSCLAGWIIWKIIMRRKGAVRLFKIYTLIGFAGTVFYMILFGICGSGTEFGIRYSLKPHFTAWIAVILFALFFVADKVLLKKKVRRVQPTEQ